MAQKFNTILFIIIIFKFFNITLQTRTQQFYRSLFVNLSRRILDYSYNISFDKFMCILGFLSLSVCCWCGVVNVCDGEYFLFPSTATTPLPPQNCATQGSSVEHWVSPGIVVTTFSLCHRRVQAGIYCVGIIIKFQFN